MKHIIFAVHGVRTFGDWHKQLRKLVLSKKNPIFPATDTVEFVSYDYGYFGFPQFFSAKRKREAVDAWTDILLECSSDIESAQIHIFAHSFGTYLVLNSLLSNELPEKIFVRNVVFAGSALPPDAFSNSFALLKNRVGRLVNDCGIRDSALLATLLVLGTGMAGRVGLHGPKGSVLQNRFFDYGHSSYFDLPFDDPKSHFHKYWRPILLNNSEQDHDCRPSEPPLMDRVVRTLGEHGGRVTILTYLATTISIFTLVVFLWLSAVAAKELAVKNEMSALSAQKDAIFKSSEIRRIVLGVVDELNFNWPPDILSPDYHHLSAFKEVKELKGSEFDVNSEVLQALIDNNGFQPAKLNGKIVFAFRGAKLKPVTKRSETKKLRMIDVRPDHNSYKSVVVVYDANTKTVIGFPASTVPSKRFIARAALNGGKGAGLIVSGYYEYVVRPLHTGQKPRIGNLGNDQEVVVRRTEDKSYEIVDITSLGAPRYPIRPSWNSKDLNSAGSIVIPGNQSRSPPYEFSGAFFDFRKALGLSSAPNLANDHGKKLGVVVLTGMDAAIASHLLQSDNRHGKNLISRYLTRIRFGSTGSRVSRLQKILGLPISGVADSKTIAALSQMQYEKFGWWDGIYSPNMDAALDFCVFVNRGC